MNIFSRILHSYHLRKLAVYILWALVLFTFLDPDFALATETLTKEQEAMRSVASVFEYLLSWVALILSLLTYLVSLFLEPGWINGTIFGLDKFFKEIWIMVSNIIYFIFAFLLIWIAFMNIIGKEGDTYQLKTALPKFIVGVLIVPFSWFFVQFVLSLSAILTASALTLPSDTFPDYNAGISKIDVYKECTINLNSKKPEAPASWSPAAAASPSVTGINDPNSFFYCPKTGDNMTNLGTIINWGEGLTSGIFSLVYTYTYGIMNLPEIWNLKADQIIQGVNTMGGLIVKLVFDFLFVLIYAILMITLGIVLAVRGIYLWLYAMLSPVFGLMYFLDKKEGGEGMFSQFNLKEFFALAMVPVYVMFALSFGLLFIYGIQNGLAKTDGTTKKIGSVETSNVWGVSTIKILGFQLHVKWATSWSTEGGLNLWGLGDSALGIVWALVLQLFWVVVLWIAIMAAMKQSKITEMITKPISDFWGQVGGLVAKSPMYAPVFPGGLSGEWLRSAWSSVSWQIENMARQKWTQFAQNNFWDLYDETSSKYQNASTALQSRVDRNNDARSIRAWIDDVFKIGKSRELAGNTQALNSLADAFEAIRTDSNYWFRTSETEFNNLMTRLRGASGNSAVVQEVLRKLDTDAKNDSFSLFAGAWGPRANDEVDTYLGWSSWSTSSTGSTTWGSVSPLAQVVWTQDINNSAWDRVWTTIQVDNNTVLRVDADRNLDRESIKRLAEHLVSQSWVGTITSDELKKWMKQNNMSEDNLRWVETEMEVLIAAWNLKDSDGNDVLDKDDYYRS